MRHRIPFAILLSCALISLPAAVLSAAGAEGEVLRPLRSYTGTVNVVDLAYGRPVPEYPEMQVIRSEAKFLSFRGDIPKTEVSKTSPPPANNDPLLKELPVDFSTHFAVLLTEAKLDQAMVTDVRLTEGKLTISAKFPPELSARPIGIGSYTLMVFPKLKPGTKIELEKQEGEDDPEVARISANVKEMLDALAKVEEGVAAAKNKARALSLARQSALSQYPAPAAWKHLIKAGVLKDGMSYAEAVAVLGHAFGMPEPVGVKSEKKKFRPAWYNQWDERDVMEGTTALDSELTDDGKLGNWRVVVLKK